MNFKKWMQILFLVVGFLTVAEYVFIQGMFTWLIAVVCTGILGLINIFFALKEQDISTALLYLLASLALGMGYFVML